MNRVHSTASLIVLISFLTVPSIAQPPDTLWTQAYGGLQSELGKSVRQTDDGGFVIVGSTTSFGAGQSDVWLIKTDSDGNLTWSQTYGGIHMDGGSSVQQTSDGGYVITGITESYGSGSSDIWLIKTDPDGNETWNQTFGGPLSDIGRSVQQTSDGGYIITGDTWSLVDVTNDLWLIKTDSSGNQIWSQTFGGTYHSWGHSVSQTIDGGFIITGETASFGAGNTDMWLIKTDPLGNETWTQTFGGFDYDYGYYVQQTNDTGYIIVGCTQSYGLGESDAYLIKTDPLGNEMWTQTFGGIDYDYGYSVQQTNDTGYIIAGYTQSFGAGGSDAWLIKTDSSGTEMWNQTYGSASSDVCNSILQTLDGGYIATGHTTTLGGGQDIWLIRLDSERPGVSITLSPINPPIQISSSGGTFAYNAFIINPTNSSLTFDAWTEVDLTNGNTFGPIEFRQNLVLAEGSQFNVTLFQNVPGFLLAGTYTYRGCIGTYPNVILDSSEFTFEKLPFYGQSIIDNWNSVIQNQTGPNGTK